MKVMTTIDSDDNDGLQQQQWMVAMDGANNGNGW